MSEFDAMSTDELLALKKRLSAESANNGVSEFDNMPTEDLLKLREGIATKYNAELQIRAQQEGAPSETYTPIGRVVSGTKAAGQGVVKGLGDVARGVGILDQLSPEEKAKFDALTAKYPDATVGEIIGQVAPFLIPGTMAARIASLPVRALASAGIGASEGAIVTKGQGGTNAEAAGMAAVGAGLGAGSEMLAPVINRGVSAVGRALGLGSKPLIDNMGRPTAAFQDALARAGVSFEDISKTGLTEVRNMPNNINKDQAARFLRFKSEGITPTTGQVTQDFAQQSREARLGSMATGPEGEPLRQRLLDQSQQFESRVNDIVNRLGVSDDAGTTIKEALSGRKKLVRKEKNDLYAKMAEVAPEVASAPILTDSIIEAIPKGATQRRIKRLAASQGAALDDLIVEFGLNQSPDAIEAFAKSGGEITPLTLGNFEDFRQALNIIERSDQTGAIKVLTSPIKDALDQEASLIDDAVKNSGLSDTGVLETLTSARQRVRELKTDFSPQSITGRLVDVKRDGVTPVVEASQVTRKLLSPTAPIEDLRNTLNVLAKSGEKGAQAIKDLQAGVVMQALDAALKAPSRKTSGVQTISGNQFAKALDALGEDKLDLIFKGNQTLRLRLNSLRQIGLDMEPASAATPKGSAPVILDALKRFGRVPGVAPVVDVFNFVISAGADDRAVAKALRGKPELQKTARQIVDSYPSLASTIGLGAIINMDKENAPQR